MATCHRSLSHPYDADLSRLLKAWIVTGVAFMLLPGTFLGVLSLFRISSAHASSPADAGWIQAHGHAQLFGWIATFILGVGFYTIPRMRLSRLVPAAAWTAWGVWTAGVTLRWAAGMFAWHWRLTLPLGAALELLAVVIFACAVYLPRPRARGDETWRTSVLLITLAAFGVLAATIANFVESVSVALTANAPVFPNDFNQRFLTLATWGFVVPFIWGFSTRWMPPLIGLRNTRKRWLIPSLVALYTGVAIAFAGFATTAAIVLTLASIAFAAALRIFEPSARAAKLRGVHPSVSFFLRLAYAWLLVAGGLAIASTLRPLPNGFVGAGRHALTVGFMAMTVFGIGPRVLPAFMGFRRLWSPRLMFTVLLMVSAGCTIRVVAQALAYNGVSDAAWGWLPVSAVLEMAAVALFAFNMAMSLTTGTPMDTYLEAQEAKAAAA